MPGNFLLGLEIAAGCWYNERKDYYLWEKIAMKLCKREYLLPVSAGLGGLGLCCRWGLYALAVDDRGLLRPNHPLAFCLGAVMLAAVVLAAAAAGKRTDGASGKATYGVDPLAGVGCFAMAAGVALTVLLGADGDNTMLVPWRLLGALSAVGLGIAGVARFRGNKPPFWGYLLPCLFLLAHLMGHYQTWSADPQIADHLFALLGGVALMLFAYQNAAFAVGSGKGRSHLFTGVLAVVLCLTAMPGCGYAGLYLGGAVFAATHLCFGNETEGTP